MRLAISGTHCCGKSTLIEAFLLKHPEYVHEPEAYEVLEQLGESFADELSADDFYRQLDHQCKRLKHYSGGDNVIFERTPLDYLAYMVALVDLDREGADVKLTKQSLAMVKDSIDQLDAIALLSADDLRDEVGESEDPELRRQVDARLQAIVIDDDFDMFSSSDTLIIEAKGTTAERLKILETALKPVN